jgi:hypothetical protein
MICPNCSAPCLPDDGFCHNCHRPLPSGLRRSTVVSWSCGIGALLGFLLVVLIAPFESASGFLAAACVAVPFTFAAACVSGLMGWVIARLACEH